MAYISLLARYCTLISQWLYTGSPSTTVGADGGLRGLLLDTRTLQTEPCRDKSNENISRKAEFGGNNSRDA